MADRALRATGVTARFGGVVALDDVAVTVQPQSIVGLIGRNGSGKSTLFNCITGFVKPAGGRIEVDGTDITRAAPSKIVATGIARTFQTPRVDFRISVHQAVLCGYYLSARSGFVRAILGLPASVHEERQLNVLADELLERIGLHDVRDTEIGKLSMGRVRLVEVARAIAAGARYLLLDEPAAGLSEDEREVLCAQIRTAARSGIGVLLVEHNFQLVRSLCEFVTVLDAGRLLTAGTPDAVARDARVIEAYLGSSDERLLGAVT
ncbi:MAG: ABC transporter ATP-binding protein [Candidatus Velthaea sp.]